MLSILAVSSVVLVHSCVDTGQTLRIQVSLVGDNDETTPAVGVDVSRPGFPNSARTMSDGTATLYLGAEFKPGEQIKLTCNKKGWVIQYPLNGEALIPADLGKQTLQVRLLPAGSKKLWSASFIEKFLQVSIEKARAEVRLDGNPREIDLSRFVKDWADEYGVSPRQLTEAVDNLSAELMRNDPHWAGLVAFSKGDFRKAGEFLEQSAEQKSKQYEGAVEENAGLRRATAQEYQDAAGSFSANYTFDEALRNYEKALSLTWKDERPTTWASLQNGSGMAHYQRGVRADGEERHRHLSQAMAAHRRALQVYTREKVPMEWANTQEYLALALDAQGNHTVGPEGATLLRGAVASYRRALEVYTREQTPRDWARAQNELGRALTALGSRARDTEGLRLLNEAVAAHRSALDIFTRQEMPTLWASVQNDLGDALRAQGMRRGGTDGIKLLQDAVAAYQRAMEVAPRAER